MAGCRSGSKTRTITIVQHWRGVSDERVDGRPLERIVRNPASPLSSMPIHPLSLLYPESGVFYKIRLRTNSPFCTISPFSRRFHTLCFRSTGRAARWNRLIMKIARALHPPPLAPSTENPPNRGIFFLNFCPLSAPSLSLPFLLPPLFESWRVKRRGERKGFNLFLARFRSVEVFTGFHVNALNVTRIVPAG